MCIRDRYGGPSTSPGIEAYVDAAFDGTAAVAAGSAYWSYDRDDGYGLLKPDGIEKAEVLAQIVRPYPERIAGKLVDWTWDEAAKRLTVRFHPSARINAPTVIRVPPRIYPAGYRVICEGCSTEQHPGEVHVSGRIVGDPAVIEVRP